VERFFARSAGAAAHYAALYSGPGLASLRDAIVGSYVYVADYAGGLVILRVVHRVYLPLGVWN
jgi:hypothetical protein